MKILFSMFYVLHLVQADRLRGHSIGADNFETLRILKDGKDCCREICTPSSSKGSSTGGRDLVEDCHLDCSDCSTDCCECDYDAMSTSEYVLSCDCNPDCQASSKSNPVEPKSSFGPKSKSQKSKGAKGVKAKKGLKSPKSKGSIEKSVKGKGSFSKISHKSKGAGKSPKGLKPSVSSKTKPASHGDCYPTDIFTDRDGCDCECTCCNDPAMTSSKAKTSKSLKRSKGHGKGGSLGSRVLKGTVSSNPSTFTCDCNCSCKTSSKSSAKSSQSKASKSKKGGSSKSSSKSTTKSSTNTSSKSSSKSGSSKSSSKGSTHSSSKSSSEVSSSKGAEGGHGCCEYKELCSGDQTSDCDKVCIKYGC